ncbi:MAG: MoaD/ThiS family protein [Nitrospirae bacterium]|nr:MoaD/ThiS family protein [Nitrospirota bacterium]
MVIITLMGDLQTPEGERALECQVEDSITIKQLIRKQGKPLREIFQLLKQKKVMVTVNKRIASEVTKVYDGDEVNIVAHDGMGRSGLTPAMY